MGDQNFVAKGTTGQVELYDNRIVISRKGLIAKANHWGSGQKEIRLRKITGIQIKKPGILTNGYIQFSQSEYSESDEGLIDATSDENSVTYPRKHHSDFKELRDRIYELQDKRELQPQSQETTVIREPATKPIKEEKKK